MEVFTIGFTKKTAAGFFGTLKKYAITRLLDVRLNNQSQLAGFTKRDDLAFFLSEICQAEYLHERLLAPTQELLDAYKKAGGDWKEYETRFLELMRERRVEDRLPRETIAPRTVLLCSEPIAEYCHRRLVLEYLSQKWGNITPVHL